jgi:hypothetical protein
VLGPRAEVVELRLLAERLAKENRELKEKTRRVELSRKKEEAKWEKTIREEKEIREWEMKILKREVEEANKEIGR